MAKRNATFTISPSQIGMLLECPRCLWLYFREGVKRPSGPFPSLPGGFDGLFKHYFDEFRHKGTLPPELEGVEGKLFDDMARLNLWRNNWKGIASDFPEYSITLKGAIDDLLVNISGDFVPLDFKTRGYPIKADTHEHYRTQLDLYALLFQKNGYPVADYGYLLFFWPIHYEKQSADFKVELVKMELDVERALAIIKKVVDIIEGRQPAAHSECEFCKFRASNNGLG